MLVGPRLCCECCGKNKVLSPCHFCQYKKNLSKDHCLGCGSAHDSCVQNREICCFLSERKLLFRINGMLTVEEFQADFSEYKLKKIPAEIGLLTNLRELDLSCNRLEELPREIGSLVNLEIFHLDSNQLKELPKDFRNLRNLRYLNILNNLISKNEIEELREALPNCEIRA